MWLFYLPLVLWIAWLALRRIQHQRALHRGRQTPQLVHQLGFRRGVEAMPTTERDQR